MNHSPFQTARCAKRLLMAAFSLFILHSARATLPEPDNILYGQIVISNQLITASRTDVVIEARRTLNGPVIASYTMGSNPKLTNLYSLRLALEAFTPVSDGNSTLLGDALVIVLRDATGILGQKNYVIGTRGTTIRTDFVIGSTDGDLNGLPDAWELANFGGPVNPNADPDGDGRSNLQEFIAGTNPNVKDGFKVLVAKNGNQTQISFVALATAGTGYAGQTRYYAIEATTNLAGSWTGVSGYTNIVGSNQSVVYLSPVTNTPPTFYRGKVWLQGF